MLADSSLDCFLEMCLEVVLFVTGEGAGGSTSRFSIISLSFLGLFFKNLLYPYEFIVSCILSFYVKLKKSSRLMSTAYSLILFGCI